MLQATEAVLMEEGLSPLLEIPVADPLEQLVRRVQGGETEAFEGLMLQTEKRVLSVAWRILGDRHLAEDAAQETYLRVFRSLPGFRLGEPFEPWLVRIAVNVCYDLGRKRGPRAVPIEFLELPGEAASSAEESFLLQQRRTLVRQGLAGLPPGERAALVLRDLEGFSTEEVARMLGIRPVTVRSQVASARAKIQAFCARLMAAPQGGRP